MSIEIFKKMEHIKKSENVAYCSVFSLIGVATGMVTHGVESVLLMRTGEFPSFNHIKLRGRTAPNAVSQHICWSHYIHSFFLK